MCAMKVLVTGADGFIGSHLVELLMQKGYAVKAFCNYNSLGSCGWIDTFSVDMRNEVEIVHGDIRDSQFVRESMNNCNTIFHLAALISIPHSYKSAQSYVETNIGGTLNVLRAAADLGISRLVHTSTSETYGTAQFVPITEAHPLVAQSPYAASKIGADQLAISYWKSFGLPVTVLRPFNTYGPRQSTRALIPTVITQLAAGQTTLKLGALSPTRDFNFVYDTCQAFIAAAESDSTIGLTLNSASNFEISVEDTALQIARIMNKDISIESEENRMRPQASEVKRLYGDSSLLRQTTSWRPEYSGLDGFARGLRITAEWFSNPDNLVHYQDHRFLL